MSNLRALLILCLSIPFAVAGQIYKQVGEDGVPAFSDRALPGARQVEVKDPVTFSDDSYQRQYELRKNRMDQESEAEQVRQVSYAVAITNPADNSAIRDNAGNLTISVSVSPDLLEGHQVELIMDGQKVRNLSGSESARLSNVDRGSHQFTARVVDRDGKTLARSPAVSVAMLRYAIKPRKPR